MATCSGFKKPLSQSARSCSKISHEIPIYIVEDHDDHYPALENAHAIHKIIILDGSGLLEEEQGALQYIYRQIGAKKLPFQDNTLIHFDAHPDLLIPTSMPADNVYDKHLLFSCLSIENWIIPAVYAGHISTIVWLKPPWSQQIADKTLQFYVGKHEETGVIKVSCTESYFLAELLYAPEGDLVNRKLLTLHVVTLNPQTHSSVNVAENDRLPHKSGDHKEPDIKVSPAEELIDDGGDESGNKATVNCLCSAVNVTSILHGDHPCSYILDIDLDFFSTGNPFVDMYTKEEYSCIQKLYAYKRPDDDSLEAIQRCTKDRVLQLTHLKQTFASLQNGEVVHFSTSDRDVTLQELVTSLRQRKDESVDFNWLHEIGCSCDDTELPEHFSSTQEISDLVAGVRLLLVSLPTPPRIITIARSSDDDYCPQSQVDVIQQKTLDMLCSLYSDTQISLNYSPRTTETSDVNNLSDVAISALDT